MTDTAETRRFWDMPVSSWLRWNWEKTAYALLIAVALIARLYGLSWRAMSHDESLHALYSWQLYDGRGYEHNPMMHGPYLFHINTLFYFLFGVNDATARLSAAISGVLMVAVVWWMRRWLGRVGALAAAIMITISPSLLYYSRYIRNDVLITLWEMVLLVAIFRYLESREQRWLYVLALAFSMAYTIKEVAFIYAIIEIAFLGLLAGIRLWFDQWEKPNLKLPFLGGLILGAALAGLALFMVIEADPGPVSPWLAPFLVGVALLALAVYLLLTGMGQRLRSVAEIDLLVWMFTFSLPFFTAFLSKLMGWDPLDYSSTGIARSGLLLGIMALATLLIGWGWSGAAWLRGAAIFFGSAVVLFTTFFTNGKGIGTGFMGSLGYWLAQQEVQRGGQPWYYYLLIVPLYEFLPLLLSLGGFITLAWAALRWRRRLTADDASGAPSIPSFVLFLAWWTILTWGAYSWAGEKMPWLAVHFAFPMTLLGGWFVDRLWAWADWRRLREGRAWWFALGLAILAFTVKPILGLIQRVAAGTWRDMTLDGLSATTQGIVALIVAVALIVWLSRLAQRLGGRQTALTAGGLAIAALTLWTLRVTFFLNYINYDLVNEMLVYAHATPDIKHVMSEIESISRRTVGDKQIVLAYDDDSTWPLEWYLREYPNKRYYGANPSRDALDAPIVIAGSKNDDKVRPFLGKKYLRYKYRLVWWPREDYKNLTWARIRGALTTPERRQKLWDIIWYRRWDTPLNQWPYVHVFYLYVRRDVAADIWSFAAGPVQETAVIDPYQAGYRQVTALQQLGVTGVPGDGPGQFRAPRAVAVAPDGRIVVADSDNHRIQVFDADGTFLTQWGSGCNLYSDRTGCIDPDGDGPRELGDGQFQQPWGVAVDAEGNVYVADTWNHRIQKFTMDGQFLDKWGFFATTDGQLGQPLAMWGPRGIAIDSQGNVYVADTGNKRVQKFSPEGQFLGQWGGGGVLPGFMDEPVGLAIDDQDQIYVADTWNRRVQKFDANFNYLLEWPIVGWESESIYNKPYIAVDSAAGLVYVTDPEGYRVLVFDTQGVFRATFGQYGNDAMSFALPNGIAVMPDGRVVVADADNHRVLIFPRVQ
ncbi:MAG: TIGR03663 family protein [Anaerolineae bacterium]